MVRVQLRVLNNTISAEVAQPEGPQSLDAPLRLLRPLDDAAIGLAVQADGKPISCRKGCSACCRAQPVPIAPQEAYALAKLIEAMPAPRGSELRARFAANSAALHEAGLRQTYLDRERTLGPEDARNISRKYFDLGLVCPFLEEDACSIYEDRPFVCRQYLVTSPAELCRDPFVNPVTPVAAPFAAASRCDRPAWPPEKEAVSPNSRIC